MPGRAKQSSTVSLPERAGVLVHPLPAECTPGHTAVRAYVADLLKRGCYKAEEASANSSCRHCLWKRLQKEKAADKRAQRLEEKRVAEEEEEAAQKAEDLLAYKKRLKAQKAARCAESKKKAQQKRWDQNRNEKKKETRQTACEAPEDTPQTPSTSKPSRIKT